MKKYTVLILMILLITLIGCSEENKIETTTSSTSETTTTIVTTTTEPFDPYEGVTVEEARIQLSKTLALIKYISSNVEGGTEYGQMDQSAKNSFYDIKSRIQRIFLKTDLTVEELVDLYLEAEEVLSNAFNTIKGKDITVNIDTESEISIHEGVGGFNSEPAEDFYPYHHPDFIDELEKSNTGVLRYVGGTRSINFDWKTGLLDDVWYERDVWGPNYLRNQLIGKGGVQIDNLTDALGSVGTKLIIDLNTFYDSPQSIGDLAKFNYDNNIPVAVYQLGNEPNWHTPAVFSSPYDYLVRMEEYAKEIREGDPNARIGISLGWDMFVSPQYFEAARNYPNKYWDIITYHSYALRSDTDTFEVAEQRVHEALLHFPSRTYTEEMLRGHDSDTTIMITESDTWNNALNNPMGYLYQSEYLIRMTANPEIEHVAYHQLSTRSFYFEDTALSRELQGAGAKGEVKDILNHDLTPKYPVTYYTFGLVFEGINNSLSTYDTEVTGDNNNAKLYSRAYKGEDGKNYILFSNRTGETYNVSLSKDGNPISQPFKQEFIWAKTATGAMAPVSQTIYTDNHNVKIMPYSLTRVEYNTGEVPIQRASYIHNVEVKDKEVTLDWWKREGADGYEIKYGTQKGNYTNTIDITDKDITTHTVDNLTSGETYYFVVQPYNASGFSEISNEVKAVMAVPNTPNVYENAYVDNNKVKVEWQSVPNTTGYKIYYGTSVNNLSDVVDVGNKAGHVFYNLINDQTYYFKIVAYNGIGESSQTTIISATPKAGLPFPPTSVLANRTNHGVNITWEHSERVVDHYIIERSTSFNGHYTQIASNVSGTSYLDDTVQNGVTYYYRIRGVNSVGVSSSYSQIATAE